jgi:CubicO group peptidase (beta-lactamase class C family)
MPEFAAYHGKTAAEHQSQFDNLSKKGFRMISLSAYGPENNARYAAVWIKKAGPAYTAVHGLPIGQYQAWFNKQTEKGFAPVLLSVTGGPGDAIVAAVFEKGVAAGWIAKHGLVSGAEEDSGTIQFWCRRARELGCILVTGSMYGDSVAGRRYAAVWHRDPQQRYHWRTAESSSGHQDWFNDFTEIPYRPAHVAIGPGGLYFSAFHSGSIGPWIARHNMTGEKYQDEFDTHKKAGFFPINVQGGGAGAATRYAAIWAKREEVFPRKWTVRGTAGAGLSAVDNAVKKFMQENAVRAGSLTILKNGAVRHERAYTWAEEDYPVTEVNSLFRLASCSKAFTCAAIQQLVDDKKLALSDRAFPTLGISSKALSSQSPDKDIDKITIQQLVDHAGGWNRDSYPDPVFNMRGIAKALGLSTAPSKLQIAQYMYGEPLQFRPGSNTKYCNFGYVLMACIVEKVSGKSFINFVKQNVLAADGITGVELARTKRSQRLANEVFYDDVNMGWSVFKPNDEDRVPNCYGGEGWTTEGMDGGGGLCSTATALARFANHHACWGLGGRNNSARTGGMAGVSSRMQSRSGNIDFTYCFNTRDLPVMSVDTLATMVNDAISASSL